MDDLTLNFNSSHGVRGPSKKKNMKEGRKKGNYMKGKKYQSREVRRKEILPEGNEMPPSSSRNKTLLSTQAFQRVVPQVMERTDSVEPLSKSMDSKIDVNPKSALIGKTEEEKKQSSHNNKLSKLSGGSSKERFEWKKNIPVKLRPRCKFSKGRKVEGVGEGGGGGNIEHNIEHRIEIPEELEEQGKTPGRGILTSTTFKSLNLTDRLLSGLTENKYLILTKSQVTSIPTLLEAHHALLKSETGTGKTLAFLVPLLQEIALIGVRVKVDRTQGTYAIIFSPSRELSIQTYQIAQNLTSKMPFLVNGCLLGGESITKEKKRIKKGMTIVIATPGRLLYHLQTTQSFNLDPLTYLIFDEADRILDQGFEDEMKECLHLIKQKKNIGDFSNQRIIMVSATTSGKISKLVPEITEEYIKIGFKEGEEEEKYSVPKSITQLYCNIQTAQKLLYLFAFLWLKHHSKIIIFVSNIQSVNYLYELIKGVDWSDFFKEDSCSKEEVQLKLFKSHVYKLHGDLELSTRIEMTSQYNKCKWGVLIATDIASRGLDFRGVKWIVHFDLHREIKEYVNRIGRTARLNDKGSSLAFCMENEGEYPHRLREGGMEVKELLSQGLIQCFMDDIHSYFHVTQKVKGKQALIYIFAFLRTLLRDYLLYDTSLISLANKAFLSSVRAYAGHYVNVADLFNYKNINLTHLKRGYGLFHEMKDIVLKRKTVEEVRRMGTKRFKVDEGEETEVGFLDQGDERRRRKKSAKMRDVIRKGINRKLISEFA